MWCVKVKRAQKEQRREKRRERERRGGDREIERIELFCFSLLMMFLKDDAACLVVFVLRMFLFVEKFLLRR